MYHLVFVFEVISYMAMVVYVAGSLGERGCRFFFLLYCVEFGVELLVKPHKRDNGGNFVVFCLTINIFNELNSH